MKNIIERYYVNEIIKIGEQNGYKYVVLWANNFFKKINKENDLISVELIKNEMPKYYQSLMSK